jgi:hypothetical protein
MKLSIVAPRIRKIVVGVAAFIVIYTILSSAVFPVLKKAFIAAFPPKDAPTVLYGLLDPLEFVEKPLASVPSAYVLNTKDGELPTLPTKAPVYKFVPPGFSYKDGDLAQKHALFLGFTVDDLITDLKGAEYSWQKTGTNSTLSISIHSKDLNLYTPFTEKTSEFKAGLTKSAALNYATILLTSLERLDDSYKKGTPTITLGKYLGSKIVPSSGSGDAQIGKIDLFRSINKVPVVGQDFSKGLLEVYTAVPAGDRTAPIFPIVSAYYREIDPTADSTYPLVSIRDAWKEVEKGGGIISSVVPGDSGSFGSYTPPRVDRVYINNIYLAYYETEKLQKYLQPIYVFEGNYSSTGASSNKGSIVLYYPAVSGQWTKAITPTNNSVEPK